MRKIVGSVTITVLGRISNFFYFKAFSIISELAWQFSIEAMSVTFIFTFFFTLLYSSALCGGSTVIVSLSLASQNHR